MTGSVDKSDIKHNLFLKHYNMINANSLQKKRLSTKSIFLFVLSVSGYDFLYKILFKVQAHMNIHKSKLMLFCLVDLYFITVFQITDNNSFFTVTQNYIK